MPKRFTATEKWDDPWYRKLPLAWKAAWQYLTDRCDTAGVIDLDEELANFHIGDDVDWLGFIAHATAKRVVRLATGKLFLPGFVAFQYGELKAECNPHRAVLKQLEKHGLLRVPEGYCEGTCTPQDKDKEKEQDKEENSEPKKPAKAFVKPTLAEVTAYCRERGKGVNPEKWLDHYESNGWRVGRNPMRDWRAAVRKWEDSEFGNKANPPPAGKQFLEVTPEEFGRLKKLDAFKVRPYREQTKDGRIRWSGQKRDGTRVECFLEPQEANA